jgi:hypothetical protein
MIIISSKYLSTTITKPTMITILQNGVEQFQITDKKWNVFCISLVRQTIEIIEVLIYKKYKNDIGISQKHHETYQTNLVALYEKLTQQTDYTDTMNFYIKILYLLREHEVTLIYYGINGIITILEKTCFSRGDLYDICNFFNKTTKKYMRQPYDGNKTNQKIESIFVHSYNHNKLLFIKTDYMYKQHSTNK